jgi:hypothetical protein
VKERIEGEINQLSEISERKDSNSDEEDYQTRRWRPPTPMPNSAGEAPWRK